MLSWKQRYLCLPWAQTLHTRISVRQRAGPFSFQQKWRTRCCLRSCKVCLNYLSRVLDASKIEATPAIEFCRNEAESSPRRHVKIPLGGVHQSGACGSSKSVGGKAGLAVG